MGGGAAIFVRRSTDHHAVPVPGLGPLEGTIIETKLVGRPVKILSVYLSPSRFLIKSDLSACLSGALLVLMAGDLNAKHVDWNSRLNLIRGKLLGDYCSTHSCLIYGQATLAAIP
jgi:hypothetical protein